MSSATNLLVVDLAGDDDNISLNVSYLNSGPTIATAIATPVGSDIQFTLSVTDPDLAINALGLVDFELLEAEVFFGGNPLAGFGELVNTGSQTLNSVALQALFGLGPNQIEIRLTDRSLRDQSMFVNAFINFTVVPEPGTALLVLVGLVGLQQASRHRTV